MRREISIITTADTRNKYEYEEGVSNDNPKLFRVEIKLETIGRDGKASSFSPSDYHPIRRLYVEDKTLVEAGVTVAERHKDKAKYDESFEDLFLDLLARVGVYPEEL